MSAWLLHGGGSGNFLQEVLCHMLCLPGLLQPEPLSLQQATADLCLHSRHTNTQSQIWLSLWWSSGFWCTQGFAWALQASLADMGFVSKWHFIPYHPVWASPLPLDIRYLFLWDQTFSCPWLFSRELKFWRCCRRRWAHILLLCHLSSILWLYCSSSVFFFFFHKQIHK